MSEFDSLQSDIIGCKSCPRLRAWCEHVAATRKAAHLNEKYWGKPVPNFGDPDASLLIVGLAPAAHGANRTGRMFTGDRSGEWLYRALHRVGAANQPTFQHADDGLRLENVLITATAHCAPPDNKPTPVEIANCRRFLIQTLNLRSWKAILCLGSIAWNEVCRELVTGPRPKFGHAAQAEASRGIKLFGSYHPSQQNTFTGRLTEPMFDSVMASFWACR